MKFRFNHVISACIALALSLSLSACGGGTSGSGVTSYEGKVSGTDERGLGDVTLSIESTGDSTTTDAYGNFALSSQATGPSVSFVAESSGFSTRFVVENVLEDSSRVHVHVTIDQTQNAATAIATHHNVKAVVVGRCARFFDNREYIRQIRKVPDGNECMIKVTLLADGIPDDGAEVALQYASCTPGATWRNETVSTTGSANDTGIAWLMFNFSNDAGHCRYRIVAPLSGHSPSAIVYPINTLAEEEAERNHTGGFHDPK